MSAADIIHRSSHLLNECRDSSFRGRYDTTGQQHPAAEAPAANMEIAMNKLAALALVATSLVAAGPSYAAGCIKGAAVGGVGGHFVGKGHAVAGAAVGCAVGHHRAKVAARQQAQQPPKK